MPELVETRRALVVLGHPVGRGPVLILVVLIVCASVEIRRSFVLIWPTVLYKESVFRLAYRVGGNRWART